MTADSDIVIVGGGPAGCAAGITLARGGHSVTLIERTEYECVRIGETLTPRARARLRELGVMLQGAGADHLPAPGIMSAWGRAEPAYNDFLLNPYGSGLLLDRKIFDTALAQSCADVGVRVLRGCAAVSCRESDGQWQIRLSGGRTAVCTRFLLDAAGRGAPVLGRHSGPPAIVDRLVGIACIGPRPASCSHTWTLIEAARDGWWYSGRLPGLRSVAVYLTDADLIQHERSQPTTLLRRRLACAPLTEARIGSMIESATAIRVPAMSIYRARVCGSNWLLAGDAAMAWDPLSGQGICNALESGIAAGKAIGAALQGDRSFLDQYSTWMGARFKNYLASRSHYYRAEQRWPDSPFWQRRHATH